MTEGTTVVLFRMDPPSKLPSSLRETILQEVGGFDICHPFHTKWYNDRIQQEGLVASGQLQEILADTDGTSSSSRAAWLVGTTKSIWPLFCQWLVEQYKAEYDKNGSISSRSSNRMTKTPREVVTREQSIAMETVAHRQDPFDTFCDDQLRRLLRCHASVSSQAQSYEIYWTHGGKETYAINDEGVASLQQQQQQQQRQDKDFLVSMARAAQVAGLCWNDDEGTKMCVHPKYGTWHTFRAVVVLLGDDHKNNNVRPPPPIPQCPVKLEEINAAKKQMQMAIQLSAADNSGVDHGKDNMTETAKSLGKYLRHAVCDGSDWSLVPPSMQAWIDLRDSFSLGRNAFRYSDPQLLYHYTKDPGILINEIKRHLVS